MQPEILPCGDCAVTVVFGRVISDALNDKVHQLAASLERHPIAGVCEWIPAYSSLTLVYDPCLIPYRKLKTKLERLIARLHTQNGSVGRTWLIPCCYDGEDMKDVEQLTDLERETIIQLHTQTVYRICMLGFLPGFVYLGGMNPRLEAPRLYTPRKQIPAGSVGIGGKQTGIYPMASPGGWRLIGRTPLKLYDPARMPAVRCQAGDRLRFYAISAEEYNDLHRRTEAGEDLLQTEHGEGTL